MSKVENFPSPQNFYHNVPKHMHTPGLSYQNLGEHELAYENYKESEKLSPGKRPLFFSQKIEQKLPEKKIPSTAAKAMSLSAKLALSIHVSAHSAFLFTQSRLSIAWKS